MEGEFLDMSLTTKKIKTTIAGVAALLAFFAPSLASAQESVTYTVKSGDTLSEIAEKYNTTVEKLAAKNNIKDIHLIFVDQVLVIEGTASTVAGRYQLTDSYLNGDYSAENQERVADAYVAERYGSWTAAKNFWLNNGWY